MKIFKTITEWIQECIEYDKLSDDEEIRNLQLQIRLLRRIAGVGWIMWAIANFLLITLCY